MPLYILISTLTPKGRETIKQHPERIKEVNKEIEELGAKVLDQYAVLGQYDFVNILDAPSDKAIVKLSIELGARGTLQPMTMAALDMDQFVSSFK